MNQVSFYPILGAAGAGGAEADFWVASYNISNNDNLTPHKISVDNDGNIYVAGQDANAGGVVFRVASNGDVDWCRSFTAPNGAMMFAQVGSDGGLYCGGGSTGDWYFNELNAATGAVQWQSEVTLTRPRPRMGYLGHNDVLRLVGWSGSPDFQGQLGDLAFVAVNSDGTQRRENGWGSNAHDARSDSVACDNSVGESIYVCGVNNQGSPYDTEQILILDGGTKLHQTGFNGPSNDQTSGVCVDTDDNVYVLCINGINNFVTKLDENVSSQTWSQSLEVGDTINGRTSDGVVCRGTTDVYTLYNRSANRQDCGWYEADASDGSLQWQRILNSGSGNEVQARSICLGHEDTYILILVFDVTDGNAVIFKLPSDGSGNGTYGDYVISTSTHTYSSYTTGSTNRSLSQTASSWGTFASITTGSTAETVTQQSFDAIS